MNLRGSCSWNSKTTLAALSVQISVKHAFQANYWRIVMGSITCHMKQMAMRSVQYILGDGLRQASSGCQLVVQFIS